MYVCVCCKADTRNGPPCNHSQPGPARPASFRADVQGTGPGGRITKDDLLGPLGQQEHQLQQQQQEGTAGAPGGAGQAGNGGEGGAGNGGGSGHAPGRGTQRSVTEALSAYQRLTAGQDQAAAAGGPLAAGQVQGRDAAAAGLATTTEPIKGYRRCVASCAGRGGGWRIAGAAVGGRPERPTDGAVYAFKGESWRVGEAAGGDRTPLWPLPQDMFARLPLPPPNPMRWAVGWWAVGCLRALPERRWCLLLQAMAACVSVLGASSCHAEGLGVAGHHPHTHSTAAAGALPANTLTHAG